MNYRTTVPPITEPVTLAEAKAHVNVVHTEDDALIRGIISAARDVIERELGYTLCKQTLEHTFDCWPNYADGLQLRAPIIDVESIQYYDSDNVVHTWSYTLYYIDRNRGRVYPLNAETWPSDALRYNAAVVATSTAGMAQEMEFTCNDAATGILEFAYEHGLTRSQGVLVRPPTAGGELPGGLLEDKRYFVAEVIDEFEVTLSTTRGGAAMVFTDEGTPSGCTLIVGIPHAIRQAILLTVGTMYENRENDVVEVGVALIPELPRGVKYLLSNYRARTF